MQGAVRHITLFITDITPFLRVSCRWLHDSGTIGTRYSILMLLGISQQF